jgi:GNAT superfamily N-acetyltransferase
MIRQLTDADVGEYRRIRLQGLLQDPSAFMMVYSDWATRPHADFAARLRTVTMFAAFEGDRLIGTIGLEDDDTTPDFGWIVEVYMTREFRGRGVSDRLMEYVLKHQSHQCLCLEVAAANAPARAFYVGHGFEDRARSLDDQKAKAGTGCEILMTKQMG